TVGLQVVREPAGAADTTDERDVLAAQPEFRQEVADRVEDDVVTASGAPPDLLVAGEVLALLGLVGGGHPGGLRQSRGNEPQISTDHVSRCATRCSHAFAPTPVSTVAAAARASLALSVSFSRSVPSNAASMMLSTSSARKAMPSTLVTDWTSTRYLPRSSSASCPRFISGSTTFG